ncbi:MAG: DEAD/DEAH box helicase, partial [Anaerolineae bacterium]
MPISILVTNQPPSVDDRISPEIKQLFESYCLSNQGKIFSPFEHQAAAFRLIESNQEVFLVAGTAAGKTLAIAVPLFHKLREGRIRKVLLMYPTIALMEDQRRVMDTLAEITGLQIGQLQGGMSRTELMAALNKPVILATPDEVYWFFRKNVKYGALLLYGLALVDEFVLDEAHLFNGLMLRNLAHLKRRVCLLGERLGKRPRWHILTATPTPELRRLTSGAEVQGQSKCGDVEVTFLEPAKDYEERQNRLVDAVETALAGGAQKVLLVFNSADLAHRVFEGIKGRSRHDLPANLQWRFGRIPWGTFKAWLGQEGIALESVEEMERWLKREGPFYLKDLDEGTWVDLSSETLVARVARLLEGQTWGLKRFLHSLNREGDQRLIEAMDRQLGSKGKLCRLLWNEVRPKLKREADVNVVTEALEAHVSFIQAGLERLWAQDSLRVTAPAFREIKESLQEAGAGPELAEAITNYLK